MVGLIRCDDRLIHGQCIFRVLNDYKIKRILLIDDITASNAVLKSIYELAAPANVETKILTSEEAIGHVEAAVNDDVSTLVLFKFPKVALELFTKIEGLKKELNIGPMSNRTGTKKVTIFSHILEEEAEDIEKLSGMGVRVYFQQVDDEKAVEWSKAREEFTK